MTDLLDHATEIELAIRIEAGLLAGEARQLARRPGAEVADLRLLEERGKAAQQRLVTANFGLVGQLAAEMARRSEADYADLFQSGCVGLIDAVHRFDHARGTRFSTYATLRIRAAVYDAAMTSRSGPGLSPARLREQRRLRAAAGELAHRLGREPSVREVAAALGRAPASVEQLLHLGDAAPIDQLGDETAVGTPWSSEPAVGELPGISDLDALPAAPAVVLRLRFGFDGGRPHSRSEVAAVLGVSVSVVRRREQRGLELLRARTPYDLRHLLD